MKHELLIRENLFLETGALTSRSSHSLHFERMDII